MSKTIDELSIEDKSRLVSDILNKKDGMSDLDWTEIKDFYDLDISTDTLRKAAVGVVLSRAANAEAAHDDGGYIERQKMRDLQGKVNEVYRSESRSELLRETVRQAVKNCKKFTPINHVPEKFEEQYKVLVVCAGDFHFGAEWEVTSPFGPSVNRYNEDIFKARMDKLLARIIEIARKESVGMITLLFVGDLIDGILRQSQLMRLQYGLVDSVIRLSEYLAGWIYSLAERTGIYIDVFGVTGNHSEIRPLGSKSRQFEDENLERIIFWYLHDRLEEHDNIFVCSNCDGMKAVQICNREFVMMHGDSEKSLDKIAMNAVNLYGHRIDFVVCGHKHRAQEVPFGYTEDGNTMVIRVPSICGMDGYAQSKGYGGYAGATALVIGDHCGLECQYPINLHTM